MKSFYEFWDILETAAAPAAGDAFLKQIEDAIDAAVESWKTETIESMKTQTKNFKQPSLWQRFTGSVQNLWHGRKNDKNPMYNQNAYGHGWGQTQKECVEKLEELFEQAQNEIDEFFGTLNETAPPTGTPPTGTPPTGTPPTAASSDPKIFNFIRAAADKLKVQLKDQVKKILAAAAAPAASS